MASLPVDVRRLKTPLLRHTNYDSQLPTDPESFQCCCIMLHPML